MYPVWDAPRPLDVFSELLNFSLLYMVYLIDADYDSA
jgi:hypothetical protein